jgi:exonuclease-1
VWLHKGAYGCAPDLVLSKHTTGYLAYVLARALALRKRGVNVVCVFDGPRTELKAETSSQRRSSRQECVTQGLDALERSKQATDPAEKASLKAAADEFFRKGVSVTQEMTTKTIAALRALGFATIVSPSEADVQLAHLCAAREADAVLTEDSDVIVYSAACGVHFPVLYKFDHHAQVAQQLSLDPVRIQKAAAEISAGGKANSFVGSLVQLLQNDLMRRAFPQMCVLAGCDYVSNIQGVGIMTALQLLFKHRNMAPDARWQAILRHLQVKRKAIPEQYLERVRQAEALFFFQVAYDRRHQRLVRFLDPASAHCPAMQESELQALWYVRCVLV